jgi:hypothetical protein
MLDNRSNSATRNTMAADNPAYTISPRPYACFGLEAAIANRCEKDGRPTTWVKHTHDGGEANLWITPTGTDHITYMEDLLATQAFYAAQNRPVIVVAVLDVQGEADQGAPATFQAKKQSIIDYIRTNSNGLITSNTPYVVVGNANGSLNAQKTALAAAQPKGYFINTTGVETGTGVDAGLHYSARGLIRIADIIYNLIYNTSGSMLYTAPSTATALRFNGGEGIVVSPSAGLTASANKFSFSTVLTTGSYTGTAYLCSLVDYANTPGDQFSVYCTTAGNYKLFLATTNQGTKSYDWPLIADAEQHTLEAVYDGARMILKLDGQTVVDVAANFTIQLLGNPRFFVAHRPGESVWKGTIYDMDISINNAPALHYSFDGNALDNSGQGNELVLTGATAFV